MKVSYLIGAAMSAMLMLGSCSTPKKVSSTYANMQFETTCLGSDMAGSETLRCWGRGTSKEAAIQNAMKNAVNEVLFSGVAGGTGCNKRALVNEVNARQRYANYFDPFFSEGGEYLNFVREDSKKDSKRVESKNFSTQAYGIVVVVDRAGLRKQLIADGILPADALD